MNAPAQGGPPVLSRAVPMAKPLSGRAPLWLRWKTMARVAWGMMFHQKLKLAGTLFGVVFATLLANQQLGTFLGLLYKNTMYVQNSGADVWITAPSVQQLPPGRTISDAALLTARAMPEVEWADGVLIGAATMQLPAGGSEPVTLVGINPERLKGGPWNVVAGEASVLTQPDTIIVEDGEREKLGGLNLGSTRELNGKKVTVGGITWGLVPFGPSYAFADYDLSRRLLKTDRDQMSAVLIGVKPGQDPRDVAEKLRAVLPDVLVRTGPEFEQSIRTYILTQTAIGITFGTSTVFALIVGFVIVSLSMLSSVVDNLREFGTLKAVGTTNLDLTKLLFVQSMTYAIIGSVIGLGLVTRVAGGIRSAKLALVMPPELIIGSIGVMCLLCVAASSLALLRIRKLEPAMVFR